MNAVLVDSDVLIDLARGRDAALARRWREAIESGSLLAYSPISAAELWRGVRAGEEAGLETLFASLLCLPIEADTGRSGGILLRRFSRSHGLELADALIAATALQHAAALWTRNERHYRCTGVAFFA